MSIMTAINEKTTITIGLVIALIGGSGFITKLWYLSDANAQSLSELKTDLKDELRFLRLEIKELRLELKENHAKLKK